MKFFKRNIFISSIAIGQLFAQGAEEVEDIRGPKPLIEIPQPEQANYTLWFVLAGIVVLAILGWVCWKRFGAQQKAKTPSAIALSDLSELAAQGERLPAAEFAERAALSIRQYIAGAFGIAAPNRTTEEFFRELPASSVRDTEGHLHDFLTSCDLAKFAAADLDASRRSKLIEAARNFVLTSPKLAEGGKTS